jgi:parallel beta-helix repeat protein
MKTILLSFLLVAGMLGYSQQTTAQRFYVDNNKPTNGDGTINNPWNNLLSAMYATTGPTTEEVTIFFRQGTYHFNADTIIFIGAAKSGSAGKYYTLRSFPGEQVIFDGAGLTTNGSYMASISDASYIRFNGLTFTNLKDITGYGLYVIGNSTNIDIRNCTFSNMVWNSDLMEASYPAPGDKNMFPVMLSGSTNFPTGVVLDSNYFNTIAPGFYGDLVYKSAGVGAVTQTHTTETNILRKRPRTDFYVSPAGSDVTGSGSKNNPWKTINTAVNAAGYDFSTNPATLIDTAINIYLRGGVHQPLNAVYIGSNRGKNGKWFTIRNYPGESAIVDGGLLTAKYAALFAIDSAKYVSIQGLRLRNVTNDSTLTTVVNGVPLKDVRYGIAILGNSAHIRIKQDTLYDMKWTRDTLKAKYPQPNDNLGAITVLGNGNGAIHDIVIDSNDLHDIVPGYTEAVTVNGNVDTFRISNNYIHDIANIGIVAAGNYKWVLDNYPGLTKANNQSRNGSITGNEVFRCLSPIAISAGIYLDGSRKITVEDNDCYNNGVGISVGNEQDSSKGAGHMIRSNTLHHNLGAGIYIGSNNHTSWVDSTVVKWNTIEHNYFISPALRKKANYVYGIDSASQRWAEIVMNRGRYITFEENEVNADSDIMTAFLFAQSNLIFRNNIYHTLHNNPCNVIFIKDTTTSNNGGGDGIGDVFYTTFHQYVSNTCLDVTSTLGDSVYNPAGCGSTFACGGFARMAAPALVPEKTNTGTGVFPNPAVGNVTVQVQQVVRSAVRLELWSSSGRLVQRQDLAVLEAGIHRVVLNKGNIKPGTYFLRVVRGAAKTETMKVVWLQ